MECAALLIYLNKTCWNGLYRVNKKGEFNTPEGRYTTIPTFDDSSFKSVQESLKGVELQNTDYKELLDSLSLVKMTFCISILPILV